MKRIKLVNQDTTFSYNNTAFTMTRPAKNKYTGLYTFKLSWGNRKLENITVSGGTNVVKGNNTPFNKLIFIDDSTSNGDIENLDTTYMYIVEASDG